MADAEASSSERLSRAVPLSRLFNFLRANPGQFTPLEVAVVYTITGHMKRDSTGAFPSIGTIARILGVTTRSVDRALQTLTQGPVPILAVQHRQRRSSLFSLVTDPDAFIAGRVRAAVLPFPSAARKRCTKAKAKGRQAATQLAGREKGGKPLQSSVPSILTEPIDTRAELALALEPLLAAKASQDMTSHTLPGRVLSDIGKVIAAKSMPDLKPQTDADAAAAFAKIRAQFNAECGAPVNQKAVAHPPAACVCGRLIVRRTTATGETERLDFDLTTSRVGGPHLCLRPEQADPATLERHGCRREQGAEG